MTDLVDRLNARQAFGLNGQRWMMLAAPDADCVEAAAEITRLRTALADTEARVEKAKTALEATKPWIGGWMATDVRGSNSEDSQEYPLYGERAYTRAYDMLETVKSTLAELTDP